MRYLTLALSCLAIATVAACGSVSTTPTDAPDVQIDAAVDAAIDAPIDAPIDATPQATLTVIKAGSSTGTVTSAPAGINCGTNCTLTADVGTTVTLTAAPDVGATFAGWTGGGCTGTSACVVTLTAATTVTATFNTARYAVTVSLMGSGAGTVTSTPAGITCPGTCTMMVDHGTTVSFAAAAEPGSNFAGWGGSCVGTGACSVTVTADTTISASFANNISLTVTRAGTGTGTVTSAPAGITCGADCTEAYLPGTIVTLTATAAVGSTFAGWAGGGCTGTGTCTITLNAAQAVTATFTLNQYTLTVAKTGTGAGGVTSSPAGINCGATCTMTVNHGASVTLTATPNAGSTFAGWSGGGCTGTGACTVTMTAATTVTATFTAIQYTLTVAKAGAGNGTVTSSPTGINCGATCAAAFNSGTAITLTATAVLSSTFTGWSGGGCTGTGTCTVTLTAATTVTANFASSTATTSSGWNCASGVSCADVYDVTLPAGSDVRITITAVTGASVPRLAAFDPGVAISGANLLTGISADRQCVGQNANDGVLFRAATAGTYKIVIARDWGASAGASGTYTMSVSIPTGLITGFTQTGDDVPSGAASGRCGYIATFASGWSCASGVSCQDVYVFDSLEAGTYTVAASSITGASVVRLAVVDGTTLAATSTNRLNGGTTDRKCVAQNTNDTATTSTLAAGTRQFAIGRDWGSSAGASGTYTYTVTTNGPVLIPRGQSVNDSASLYSTTSCP